MSTDIFLADSGTALSHWLDKLRSMASIILLQLAILSIDAFMLSVHSLKVVCWQVTSQALFQYRTMTQGM